MAVQVLLLLVPSVISLVNPLTLDADEFYVRHSLETPVVSPPSTNSEGRSFGSQEILDTKDLQQLGSLERTIPSQLTNLRN